VNTRELAAAYVLDELDPSRRAEIEGLLDVDAKLRAEVDALRPMVGRLEALPAEAWPEDLDAEAVPEIEAVPEHRSRRRSWSLRPAVAIACLAFALVLGGTFGAVLLGDGGEDSGAAGTAIALRPLAAPPAAKAAVRMPDPGSMVMDVRGLPRLSAGEYYELWLLGDADRVVPVASFRVGESGTATVRVPLPADPAAFRYFDVSRQLVSEGTTHSGDSVLRGPTAPS
jgi:anti-sigma-K factor RskA